ncbi:squalene epoxidase [Suillus hirtellus]|nr:squalene epoxidase [Suillus hirtellus]
MPSSSYDVLIIGAGIAGPALAHALATKTYGKRSTPLRIAVLERSMAKPDRMVAELLQPGGVMSLKQLGLESCLGAFDSAPLSGFYVMRGADNGIYAPFPEGHEARAFEHGAFVMALRDRARRAPNVDFIETTVTALLENEDTNRIIGVSACKTGGQPEAYFADLVVVADGGLSKFRTAVLGHMPYEPTQMGYLAGLIVKDLTLPVAKCATMIVLKRAGPVVLYELPNNECRMLVEFKEPPPDLKEHILRDVVPQLPASVRAPILNALETSRLRRAPHYYLPSMKQGESSKAGAFLMGDSLNMRHPLTAGGMTVALNDAVILSDLLADIEDFGNWNEVSAVLRNWHHLRKPLASTINTMSMSWAGLFAAEGEAFDIMQDGAFKFFGKGPEYSEEPMALAAGIAQSPLRLARSSLAIALYSIWVLFTHPRAGSKYAPPVYEYPMLFVKALNVIWTMGMVMGPVLWAEM